MLIWYIICASTFQSFNTQQDADSKFADNPIYIKQHKCKQPIEGSSDDENFTKQFENKEFEFIQDSKKSDKEPEEQVEPSRNPANLSEDSHCKFDFVPVGYRTVKFVYYCQ